MSRDIADLLDKSREDVRLARLILSAGSPAVACSRAYFAMFYVAEAWLLSLGQQYASHKAVAAAFGRDVAKPGLVPRDHHGYLLEAFEGRHVADYGDRGALNDDQAAKLISQAEEMIRTAEASLLSEEPGGGRPGQEPTEGS